MNLKKNNQQLFKAKVAYVPRQLSASPPKVGIPYFEPVSKPMSQVLPIHDDDHHYSTPYTNDTVGKTLSTPEPDCKSIYTAKNNRLSGRLDALHFWRSPNKSQRSQGSTNRTTADRTREKRVEVSRDRASEMMVAMEAFLSDILASWRPHRSVAGK